MTSKNPGANENMDAQHGNNPPKIEVVRCPQQKNECVAQLPLINQCYNESQLFRLNKDYHQSIHVLQQAFEYTFQISDSGCTACADMFRQLIIATLEAIRHELHEMTTGWFGAHDYRVCLELATQTLQECRLRR